MAWQPVAERVRIKSMMPPGHVRTPAYLRGKCGVIERKLSEFSNPERAAYRLNNEMQPLVRVRFSMAEIWGDAAENPTDTLDAEIYAHWLERAE